MPLANRLRLLYRKGSHNEADPLSRRPDFSSEIPGDFAATMWWDGEVPECSGQPVLPGDATDVLGGAIRENVSPTLDVTDVSADLLTQIRQGYEADPFYRPLFKSGPISILVSPET